MQQRLGHNNALYRLITSSYEYDYQYKHLVIFQMQHDLSNYITYNASNRFRIGKTGGE